MQNETHRTSRLGGLAKGRDAGPEHDVSEGPELHGAQARAPASRAGGSAESSPDCLYGIAELSAEFDITPRTIRFYETKHLLSPPRVNGARVYTRRERARLTLILRAKSIGFSLAEIKQFLDLYGDRGEGRPQQAGFLAERSGALIRELEQRQENIAATLRELREIRGQCLQFLEGNGGGAAKGAGASTTRRAARKRKQPE